MSKKRHEPGPTCRKCDHPRHDGEACDVEVKCIDCGDCEMGNHACGCGLYDELEGDE